MCMDALSQTARTRRGDFCKYSDVRRILAAAENEPPKAPNRAVQGRKSRDDEDGDNR